MNFNIL